MSFSQQALIWMEISRNEVPWKRNRGVSRWSGHRRSRSLRTVRLLNSSTAPGESGSKNHFIRELFFSDLFFRDLLFCTRGDRLLADPSPLKR